VKIALPSVMAAQYSLVLATTLCTFGAYVLREYESGLTQPLIVDGWRPGEELEIVYRLGKKPGFQLERTTYENGRDDTNSSNA
jgi:hypothetical protein